MSEYYGGVMDDKKTKWFMMQLSGIHGDIHADDVSITVVPAEVSTDDNSFKCKAYIINGTKVLTNFDDVKDYLREQFDGYIDAIFSHSIG